MSEQECGAISHEFGPGIRYRCVMTRGHGGDHYGDEVPTVTLDESDAPRPFAYAEQGEER